jgi:hypothetical protein
LGESSCYSMVYSRLGEHARTGDCTLLDHAGRLLLECPEWSLLSVYISYASLCDRLPELTSKFYSALKLFMETLDCESLEGGYRITCYSAKRLAYHVEPKMREVTPGEEWLLRRILHNMSREELLHALCKALGIISYLEIERSHRP